MAKVLGYHQDGSKCYTQNCKLTVSRNTPIINNEQELLTAMEKIGQTIQDLMDNPYKEPEAVTLIKNTKTEKELEEAIHQLSSDEIPFETQKAVIQALVAHPLVPEHILSTIYEMPFINIATKTQITNNKKLSAQSLIKGLPLVVDQMSTFPSFAKTQALLAFVNHPNATSDLLELVSETQNADTDLAILNHPLAPRKAIQNIASRRGRSYAAEKAQNMLRNKD